MTASGLPRARRLQVTSTELHLTPDPVGQRHLILSDKLSGIIRCVPLHDLFRLAAAVAQTRELHLGGSHSLPLNREEAYRLARLLRHFHTPQLEYSVYPVTGHSATYEACDRQVLGASGLPFGVTGEQLPDWAWQYFDPQREARQLFAASLRAPR